MLIKEYFKNAQANALCNTSYPLSVSNWEEYKNSSIDLFQDEKDLCFYIHVPFCKRLCAFCEYVKYRIRDIESQKVYLAHLENEVMHFLDTHPNIMLYGFDIGGGTPTSLDDEVFQALLELYQKILTKCSVVEDFEPSIETTFDTLTKNKIKMIKSSGIDRISLGIQTTNSKILKKNNRIYASLTKMQEVLSLIKEEGISKVNLDLMYGLKDQTKKDLQDTLKTIAILNPEQVTLYEMRYNMVSSKRNIDRRKMYTFYKYLYKQLRKMGYYATFSQNTFSKDSVDKGLSSYLRYRMIENISYKGFGISAQSKSRIGISYNIGKTRKSFNDCVKDPSFKVEDNYVLPKEELFSKYVSISLYYGRMKKKVIKEILGTEMEKAYKEEMEFLHKKKLIRENDEEIYLTPKGFFYYGAIASLFYAPKVKAWLIENGNK